MRLPAGGAELDPHGVGLEHFPPTVVRLPETPAGEIRIEGYVA
jgi:hypothetical protein